MPLQIHQKLYLHVKQFSHRKPTGNWQEQPKLQGRSTHTGVEQKNNKKMGDIRMGQWLWEGSKK